MRAELRQPLSALGLLFLLVTAGFLVSSSGIGRLLGRTGLRTGLAGGLFLAGLAMLLAAVGSWPAALLAMVLYGLALGVVDGGVNVYSTFRMSGGGMQLLHGLWGAGTLLGPLLVTFLLVERLSWRLAFVTVGGLELALGAVLVLGAEWPGLPEPVPGPPRTWRPSPPMLVGMLAFFLYTGIEATAGGWSFTLLTQGRGLPAAAAGVAVSTYWAGLTLGRLGAGMAGARVGSRALLVGGVVLALVAALGFWLAPPVLSLVSLPLLGLGLAPVYPALMSLTSERLPAHRVAAAVGYQTAAAGVGGSTVPAGAGLLMQGFGLAALGPFLAVAAGALAATYWVEARVHARGAAQVR